MLILPGSIRPWQPEQDILSMLISRHMFNDFISVYSEKPFEVQIVNLCVCIRFNWKLVWEA